MATTEFFVNQSLLVNGVGSYADPFNIIDEANIVRDSIYRITGLYRGQLLIGTAVDADKHIKITSYGDDHAVFTSRLLLTTAWTNLGGGIYSTLLPSTPYVFWAGFDGESIEIEQDTTTPTAPAANKWGLNGLTLYWHPSTGYPAPEDAGAFFEWSGGSRLSGISVATSYVDIEEVDCLRSVYHGVQVSGSSLIVDITGRFIDAAYNGNQTYNGPRIGNGIAVMYFADGVEFYRCNMHHNIDHGGNAEGLSGTNPRPKNVLFDWCNSYENGSRGYAFSSSSATYPLLNISVNRGEIYNNGTRVAFIPGTTPTSNSRSGISYNVANGNVTNVHIHHNQGAGIWLNGGCYDGLNGTSYLFDNNIINNNNLYGNAGPGDAHGISFHRVNSSALSGGTKGKIYIRNNLIFDNGSKNVHQYYTPFDGSLDLLSNIIYGATTHNVSVEGTLVQGESALDGNMYDADNVKVRLGSTTYSTLSSLNAVSVVGTELVGTATFRSASDYHPADNSPAVGAGINTGLTSDFEGKARPGARGYTVGPLEAFPPVLPGGGEWSVFDGTIDLPVALSSNAIGSVSRVVGIPGNPPASLIKRMVEFG